MLPDPESAPTEDPAAVRLWLRLLSCSMIIEKRLRRRLVEQFDTTLPRFDVLAALDRRPDGMNMGELSQALLVSGGNLTRIVRELDRQGQLRMKRDPGDRRSWLVTITASGRRHVREVSEQHHQWIAAMFAGLSTQDAGRFYGLLAELKSSVAADPGDRGSTRRPTPGAHGQAEGSRPRPQTRTTRLRQAGDAVRRATLQPGSTADARPDRSELRSRATTPKFSRQAQPEPSA